MNKIFQTARKNMLLVFVIVVYVVLFILKPGKAMQAFQNSLYYVREMIIIMPVILLLTALINAWVPQKAIQRNLGRDSGIKGAIFSFLFGSFSAGPLYAAFPVSKTLLAKGASISNIVILLGTWAVVKVPMLINEAKFLGPKFMLARWVLTTISIFIMGFITAKFVTIDDLPAESNREWLGKIRIDSDYCIGCGLCAKIAPSYFRLENKKAMVLRQDLDREGTKKVKAAIEQCPPQVIALG
ncbi:MAG TPA: permease [bacterium]|nr:permease [bacterium]